MTYLKLVQNNSCLTKFSKYRFTSNRFLCSNIQNTPTEKIRVPTPWGYLHGELWGSQKHRPILALPGWKDNIGTLIPLIREVSKHISVVCLDIPGQGLSDHFPNGVYYTYDYVFDNVRRAVKYFNWKKVSLLGHSLGSGLSFIYASLYPNEVDFLIGLDTLAPLPTKAEDYVAVRLQSLNGILDLETKKFKQRAMSYEEAQQFVAQSSHNSIPVNLAHHWLERELIEAEKNSNKYYFRMDPRHNIRHITYPKEYIYQMAEHIKCPILNIKTTGYRYTESEEVYRKVREIITKNQIPFQSVMVEETSHHLHLIDPKGIAKIVNAFIKRHDQEQRYQD